MAEKDQDINYTMLEIRHVSKVYTAKGGVTTHALNDVSISFGERGLVFLLGKSGSGKSTLLNVSGGLDEPTGGEIIVKGKSSKNFTGSDFDSYRNTFVGFIFQEYNILDEFNVEDNIALALELQGKSKDKEKIAAILRDVELEAYAKRKPNTLSGGQKQRIAIARALVKDPQIIMADEPTGALDSATGKQVFDTLKKLSKTRLVIVVSHDREFAEIYGDRIIELADGKIISDMVKTHVPATELDTNVSVIGGNTLSIKKGTSLTPENIKTIQEFIRNTDGDVIISNGEKEISNFKKVNRMSESGATEKFENAPENLITQRDYTAEESKFIRSRLPMSKAIRIGASGLKVKPVRLAFTILLSVIAFIMFGLFSTLMFYDGDSVLVKSFVGSDYEHILLQKQFLTHVKYSDGSEYTRTEKIKFTEDDVDWFKQKYGADTVPLLQSSVAVNNVTVSNAARKYYFNTFDKFAYIPEGNPLRNKITGAYPENDGEIVISSYMFEVLKENDTLKVWYDGDGNVVYGNADDKLKLNSVNDIIGKYVELSVDKNKLFKVTGVIDSGEIPSKYDTIKKGSENNYMVISEYQVFISGGLMLAAFTSESFFETYANIFKSNNYYYSDDFDDVEQFIEYIGDTWRYDEETAEWKREENTAGFGNIQAAAYEGNNKLSFCSFNDEPIGDDGVYFSAEELIRYEILFKSVVSYLMENSTISDPVERYWACVEEYQKFTQDINTVANSVIYDSQTGYWISCTDEERAAAIERVEQLMGKLQPISVTVNIDDVSHEMKLKGFYYKKDRYAMLGDGFVFSKNFIDKELNLYSYESSEYTAYEFEEGQIYDGLLLSYDGTENRIRDITEAVGEKNARENDVCFTMVNSIYLSVETVNDLIESISLVFLIIGIVFAVFSSLLLFNFISVSIANKRKEIGILRAVGARGLDVFKIFFSESGIIVCICTAIAIIGSFILCAVINGIIKTEAGLGVTLFVFGPASIGILIGIAILVAVISTFLPVFFASRKKPVESIRAL